MSAHLASGVVLTDKQVALFWSKVDKNGPLGCWVWTKSTVVGYGKFYLNQSKHWAHRLSYELVRGAIPDGLHLDHLCRNTICVNPDHLDPVEPAINNLRGIGPCAINARKTHCKHGHPFTPENTGRSTKGRYCRTCDRLRARAKRAAIRSAQ